MLTRVCVVYNKIDLTECHAPGVSSTHYQDHVLKLFRLSAKTRAGLDDLRDHLTELAGYQSSGGGISALGSDTLQPCRMLRNL